MEYRKARSIDEALSLIRDGWIPLAGSTTLGRVKKATFKLVDITGLPFRFVEREKRWLLVGSLTTLEELKKSLRGFRVLLEALFAHSCYSIRAMATLGGAVATSFPYSDIIPSLLVLDADVLLLSEGEETWIPIEDYLKKRRALLKDSLIGGVRLPLELEEAPGSFKKLSYTSFDYALLNVAFCRFDDEVRVSVGSRPGVAKRLRGFERSGSLEEGLQEADLGSCFRVSAWWRKEVLRSLLDKVLKSG